jgi:glycosyltransferase involved in cell wall biosynthesis
MKIIRTATIPESLDILLKGQLKFLNQYFDVIGISGKGKALENVRSRETIQVIEVEFQRRISLIKDLITQIMLYKVFRRGKPQIVHSITPKAGLLSMLAAKMARVPIRMHTFTGLIFPTKTGFIQKLLIKMDQLLCWATTNIYPEGNGVKQDLISYGITSKALKVLANGNVNGIDINHFSVNFYSSEQKEKLKEELRISLNEIVFCFVGRLVKDKGINELVQAFTKINNAFPQTKLLLVGSFERELDPLLPETEKEIQDNLNIIAVGYQNDVRSYFAISDIFVFPSYREGFPNVVMQAGAMELPSIVTDINGCNEIVEDGVNGLIIPSKNKEQLKEKMLLLLENPDLRNQLKQNAREMITSRYEQKMVWEALLDEYRKLEKETKK